MAGLVSAIHAFLSGSENVDARDELRHDGGDIHNPICRDARSFMISSVPPPMALTLTSR